MRRFVHGSVLVLLAAGNLSGCDRTPRTASPIAPEPPPPRVGVEYVRVSPSMYSSGSKFILYADGTFELRYAFGGYPGRYSHNDTTVAFTFDADSGLMWFAAGALHGDTLTVHYNNVMIMADFEDGAYAQP